jgi:hypothetical protein
VTLAQAVLLLLWKTLPQTHSAAVLKLSGYLAVLAEMAWLAYRGTLPRTRPIIPGESMVAD